MKFGDTVQLRHPASGNTRGPFLFLFSLPCPSEEGEHAYLRHRQGVKGGYRTEDVLRILPRAKETIDKLGLHGVDNWVITIPREWIERVPS